MFWGGREGYQTLLNTDIHRELDHMGAFFKMVVGMALLHAQKYDYFFIRSQEKNWIYWPTSDWTKTERADKTSVWLWLEHLFAIAKG